MTSKKLKKTFTAAFLSGSILLQNFPALAAASDTTDWLKESPFRQDITTEKSTPTESVPSETETVSPETLSTFQTEAETEAETEIPEESKSSNNTASFLMADNSDTFFSCISVPPAHHKKWNKRCQKYNNVHYVKFNMRHHNSF